ncbi:MAG: fluoride efflux transporter CrcB [Rhodospirillales bacterium]|nr:fluoride efflux transporter CrcB [Rhodospirillales bacterium]
MSIKIIASIAIGGAAGAVARYAVMGAVGHWLGTGFPYATLAVNVLGCFAMGALVETFALVWSANPETQAFLTVGFLGAFTTFSAFTLDVNLLMAQDRFGIAALYVAASVLLSVLAFFAGMYLFRHVLP